MLNSYVGSRETIADTRDAWHSRLLIDGQNVESVSGRSFKTLNAAIEEVIAIVAEGNEADALRIATGTAYSLAAGVWITEIGRMHGSSAIENFTEPKAAWMNSNV